MTIEILSPQERSRLLVVEAIECVERMALADALDAAGRAILLYRDWREPYCVVARICFLLGDTQAGECYVSLAGVIVRPPSLILDPNFYEPAGLQAYAEQWRQQAALSKQQAGIPPNAAFVRLVAGGDVMLGRQMPGWVALKGAAWPFQGIADALKNADLSVVNLETCVSVVGDFFDKGGRQPYYYHAPADMLRVLMEAGIQCVSTANNHTMDYGAQALVQECEILEASRFLHFGAGHDYLQAAMPGYFRVKGLCIAFIGVETETAGMCAGIDSPGIHHASGAELLRSVAGSIAIARAHADVIIVSPHWGPNWQEAPDASLRETARRFIDLGADAVLGHSAHILQGLELHAGRPIVYDMGTLMFDRVAQRSMSDSALFELELDPGGVRQLVITPVKLTSGQAHLARARDAARIRQQLVQLSQALDPSITFESEGECLRVHCTPLARQVQGFQRRHTEKYVSVDSKAEVSQAYSLLRSNLVDTSMPAECRWDSTVIVNSEIELLGARFASPVRPGRGFVCEVYFRATAPQMPSRIEACLMAVAVSGANGFVYTHPVAEGIHPPARWNKSEIICDRVVARPGEALVEGVYDLFWYLRDLENGTDMRADHVHHRIVADKIFLGKLSVSQSAPNGVAGVAEPLRMSLPIRPACSSPWHPHPLNFWQELASPWVERELKQLGLMPHCEAATVLRNNPWGLVMRVPTEQGNVFFKALGQANRHEPSLLEYLSARWPDRVPRPLAIQRTAAWMILPDCGHALLGTEGKLGSPALWQVLLPRFAEIQIESYQDAQRWLALGVPDRRLALLPAQFAQLLSDESAIALDQTEGLQRKEREQARQMLPYLEACCQALSASAYSVGLCQGDFHTGNILSQGSSVVFADWGDASVTHPFCSLLLFYHTVGLTDDTVLQRADELAKPYLRPWCARTGESIEALIQTLHAALWIAHVIRALCWDRHQPQLEQRQGGAPQTLVVKWIRLWLRRKDLLMRNPMITEAPSSAPLLRPSKLATGDNRLLLSIEEIARLTGGQWQQLRTATFLTGVSCKRSYLAEGSAGNLFFLFNEKASDQSFGAKHVSGIVKAIKMGAAAAVVPRSAEGLPADLPLLRVDNTYEALKTLGEHVRDRFTGKRVIVTGTEGKTGFKCMLHHVLSPQISTHAICNSSNLDVALYASLASIRQRDQVAILEASVANPGRGEKRSQIVKPHVFVITEVGNEHILYHGSQQAIIEAKAGIVAGVCDSGYGILNADSQNYQALRKAVLTRRRLPLLLFGSTPSCNGQLVSSRFENNGWIVSAEIEGSRVEYRLPLLGEHAPLASVSVLLTAYYLGADVGCAAADFADYVPYESQGVLRRLRWQGGEISCYDNASRASVLSYQSTLRTAARMTPPATNGRKVALIGEMIFLGEEAQREHVRLAAWIDAAGFDSIILVGENTEITFANLKNQGAVVKRFPSYDRRHSSAKDLQALIDALLELVTPGDLLFVKGEVDEVGEYLRSLVVMA